MVVEALEGEGEDEVEECGGVERSSSNHIGMKVSVSYAYPCFFCFMQEKFLLGKSLLLRGIQSFLRFYSVVVDFICYDFSFAFFQLQ